MEYTYSGLRKKYGDFMVPAFEIKVDDVDIKDACGCIIQGLSVSLSALEAGTAVFQICGCYDPESHSIDRRVKNGLKLGSKVEISLGYGSDLTKVFVGYIDRTGVSLTVESSMIYTISAADPVKLMKEGGKRSRILHVTSCKEAFEEIMSGYSGLCSTEADEDEMGEMELFQDCSDYDFICKKLIQALQPDYEFFVSAGVAYYRKKNSGERELLDIKPGGGIRHFQWSANYLNRKVTVLGLGPGDELLSAECEASALQLSDSAILEAGIIKVPEADSQEKIDGIAEDYISKLSLEKTSGFVAAVGLPELFPGNRIKISEIDSQIDGVYGISSVRHTIGENGFQSEVALSGKC